MKKLSLIDLAFLLVETEDSPKHVAGLMIFKPPLGKRDDFARELYEELCEADKPLEPFNLEFHMFSVGGPSWRPTENFDLSQHLFYHRPETPLSRSDLYEMISKLHEPRLDRSRPLWEFHIIDNVEKGRFAIYSKIHHAYADGVTLTGWTSKSLNEKPDAEHFTPVWQLSPGRRSRRSKRGGRSSPAATASGLLRRLLRGSVKQLKTTGGLARLGAQLTLERFGLTKNAVSLPFRLDERTPLMGQVTAERQFAKASVPMAHVKRIRDMCRATLNHVALTCVDGALHQYLKDSGSDIRRPISIQMPVSLRSKEDTGGGNQIGLIAVDLSRTTDDPYERLREIGFTLRNVRNQIDGVPAASIVQYSIILGVASQLTELLRLNDVLPSISDTVVSNVPGPAEHLYLKDAIMEEMCPVSTLIAGSHLNITLYSYAGTLQFGLVATRELGDLQRLAAHIEKAFVDLEEAVFHPRKSKSKSKPKPMAKKRAPRKRRAKA